MDVKLIKRGNPTVALKNGDNPKIHILRTLSTPIYINGAMVITATYAELMTMISSNALTVGAWYRIDDYVTKVSEPLAYAQSAEHPFDILVMANTESVLNENALAVQHSGDTYFSNSNLATWELKFDINNDTTKYAWADAENGKGVIYWMKDEFGNEAPYDFKNIQFRRYAMTDSRSGVGFGGYYGAVKNGTPLYTASFLTTDTEDFVWVYTFNNSSDNSDASLDANCKGNLVGSFFDTTSNTFVLPNNVFFCGATADDCIANNILGIDSVDNTFLPGARGNTTGDYFEANLIGNYADSNTFGASVFSNVIADDFHENIVDSSVSSCTIKGTSVSAKMRYTHFLSGLAGLAITVPYVAQAQVVVKQGNSYDVRIIQTFEGADSVDSVGSLVPIATVADKNNYLKGDGSWSDPCAPFEFVQAVESTVWTIQHNLGRNPTAVKCFDTAGTYFDIGQIEYVDLNTLKLYWNIAIKGKAYIS